MTKQELVQIIDRYIRENGNKDISGPILNAILVKIVDTFFSLNEDNGEKVKEMLDGLSTSAGGVGDYKELPRLLFPTEFFNTDLLDVETIALRVINDLLVSESTTFSSKKINELLEEKIDIEVGKGLSQNDLTNELLQQLNVAFGWGDHKEQGYLKSTDLNEWGISDYAKRLRIKTPNI